MFFFLKFVDRALEVDFLLWSGG